MQKKKGKAINLSFPLPDLDSNQDKLYQKQLYYPYTIGQSASLFIRMGCKNRVAQYLFQIF